MDRVARDASLAMEQAQDYSSWRQAAELLDSREGLDEWKEEDSSEDYDWRLIRGKLQLIRHYRAEQQTGRLIHYLRQGLHWNLGNIGSHQLYGRARVGTKRLIESYVAEVCSALDELADTDEAVFPLRERLKFFQEVTLSFGRSSLMLSGGATLGLFHVGVVKALLREGVLPLVLSGSSAGSVVAATIGTRRQDELEELLSLDSAYYHFWQVLPWKQALLRRALMDPEHLRKAIARNVRDLTFEEAQKLSGRIVNITVSPAGVNQPPRLLNHLTFPYLYLREAVLASCAVPLLFPPVMLMTRDADGDRVPYTPTLRWNDGSLRADLPMLRLRRLHNVNHFVVSQTNPHVLPFLSKLEPGTGGLFGSTRDYAYSSVRSQTSHLLNFARANLPLGPLRRPLETAASILDQDYRGNINIQPDVSLRGYIQVTRNPTREAVQRFIFEGERAAWPRLEMIRTQTSISLTLDRCVARLEQRAAQGSSRRELPRQRPLKVVRKEDAAERNDGVAEAAILRPGSA